MSNVTHATAEDFSETVLKSEVPVLVDFWASWCAPCRAMGPILDEVSVDLEGKIKIVKVDVEDPANRDLAMQYQIRSIPNMKLFKGGEVAGEFVGLRQKDALIQELEAAL